MTITAYISHNDCRLHEMGAGHPESPLRLSAIANALAAEGLGDCLVHHEAPLATHEQILRVHTAAHLDRLQKSSPTHGTVHLDPDTAMNPHSWNALLRAAGAGVLAVDLVMNKTANNAFCAVRPPGHHAEKNRAMGFCFVNNVAIAAAHALTAHGLERVAVADFDVHHGNGTEDIFSGDERVRMVSIFQHPHYPYSGTDHPAGNMFNVPLPAGSDGKNLRSAVNDVWLPALREFEPELIIVSAGFDAHKDDELGGLNLTDDDYAWITTQLLTIANEHAAGRIVSMLEGGYELSALARSVGAHLRALAADQT